MAKPKRIWVVTNADNQVWALCSNAREAIRLVSKHAQPGEWRDSRSYPVTQKALEADLIDEAWREDDQPFAAYFDNRLSAQYIITGFIANRWEWLTELEPPTRSMRDPKSYFNHE